MEPCSLVACYSQISFYPLPGQPGGCERRSKCSPRDRSIMRSGKVITFGIMKCLSE